MLTTYAREGIAAELIAELGLDLAMPDITMRRVSSRRVKEGIRRGYVQSLKGPRIYGEKDTGTIPVDIDDNPVTPDGIRYKGVTELRSEYRSDGGVGVYPRRVGFSAHLDEGDVEGTSEHEFNHVQLLHNKIDLTQYADVKNPHLVRFINEVWADYKRVLRAKREGNHDEVKKIFLKSPYKKEIAFGSLLDQYYRGPSGKGFYAFYNDMVGEWKSMKAALYQFGQNLKEAHDRGEVIRPRLLGEYRREDLRNSLN